MKLIQFGDDHRGGTVDTPAGTSYWCGEDWQLQAGPATVWMMTGRARRIFGCRLPDGSRGDVQISIDHEHVFRKSAATGKLEIVDLGIWKRPLKDADGKDRGFMFGTVEITAADAVFTDRPEVTRRKVEFTSMARDMSQSPALMEAIKTEDMAIALYGAMCNVDWVKAETGERFSPSWRSAGGLVADLRGLNESYTTFYCSGNEGQVSAEIAELLNALGWTEAGENP